MGFPHGHLRDLRNGPAVRQNGLQCGGRCVLIFRMILRRSRWALCMIPSLLLGAPPLPPAKPLGNAPIDPAYLTRLEFGKNSHWIQPWRAYLETMPASQFLNGVGLNFNPPVGVDYDQLAQMCARNGVRSARVEIGWGNLDFDDDSRLEERKAGDFAARLEALGKHGIRPLVLLNAHHGVPCPAKFFQRGVVKDAPAGAREVELDNVDGLVAGHSGINYFGPDASTKGGAAHYLVVAIQGRTITLSQPLAQALPAGKVALATLKYAPFGKPSDPAGRATIEGWKRYTATVARFVAAALGTSGKADLGFDLEVWNELTFGSRFLSRKNYYEKLPSGDDGSTRTDSEILKATAEAVAAEPGLFKGVRLGNGFANQRPWDNPSEMPAGFGAVDKHPYPRKFSYPKDLADFRRGEALDAHGLKDAGDWDPTYEAVFPEYYAAGIQTETLCRDMAPFSNKVQRGMHGRFSREGNAKTPCWVWLTEINLAPDEIGVTDRERALALKAKIVPRLYCFFLNKGAERVELFALYGRETNLGLFDQSWVDQTRTNRTYPADDSAVTPLALKVVGRIAAKMRDGQDAIPGPARQLGLAEISDTHNHVQFAGDPKGRKGHPPLYDRDVFAFLPFQVSARKFVIPYYVMTRDIRNDLAGENFDISITGVRGAGAMVTMYDPLLDRAAESKFAAAIGRIKVTVNATDYPRLLIIEEK
jgi:hypothetical protein